MDHRQAGWIVIGVIFCMSFTADFVQGKCAGQWAKHSCMGGNKRSEEDDFNEAKSRSAIKSAFLQQLLSKSTRPASLVRRLIHDRREKYPKIYRTSGLPETDSYNVHPELLRLLNRLSLTE